MSGVIEYIKQSQNNRATTTMTEIQTKQKDQESREKIYDTDEDCVMCGGTAWYPTVGEGSNYCPCTYYETHPQNREE